MTLAEFLLARIAEDEAAAREALLPDHVSGQKRTFYSTLGSGQDDWGVYYFNVPVERVIAECEAKRRIVDYLRDDFDSGFLDPRTVFRLLALAYAGHPDYQQEWAL